MKKHSLLYLLFLLLFAACSANTGSESEATDTPEGSVLERAPELTQPEAEEDVIPRVTITPTPEKEDAADEAYPLIVPTLSTALPEGYPEPEDSLPPAPYPADRQTIWVVKPAGEQCAESLDYATEQDAVASLEAAAIETLSAKTVEFMVTSSCGSPTSTHYAVEINAADLATAEALDWRVITLEELGEG